jgi:hypothetical protein
MRIEDGSEKENKYDVDDDDYDNGDDVHGDDDNDNHNCELTKSYCQYM